MQMYTLKQDDGGLSTNNDENAEKRIVCVIHLICLTLTSESRTCLNHVLVSVTISQTVIKTIKL